ncbi:hypothetical protein, partial [Parasphingorhabdus sp.]
MMHLGSTLLLAGMVGTAALAQPGAQEDSTLESAGNKVTEPFDGKEVPQKLKDIQDAPYSLSGMSRCAAIIAEVRELNDVLGPDVNERVNKSLGKKREETAARVAGSALGSIIPFGGI